MPGVFTGALSASSDGQLVVYQDDNSQIQVVNVQTGASEIASVNLSGDVSVQGSLSPGISGDGSWVIFQSFSFNLVPNDTNAVNDVFARGPFR